MSAREATSARRDGLAGSFDRASATPLCLTGVHVAKQGEWQAAVMGRPQFDDAELDRLTGSRGAAHALLVGWCALGPALLEQMHGSFAFVIGNHQELILATDRLGIEPLCYRVEPSGVVFGTRAEQVAAMSKGMPELSEQAIYHYLFFHVIPSPLTIFAGVTRLLPGHYLKIGSAGMALVSYFSPDYRKVQAADFSSLKRQFRGLLEDTVRSASQGRGTVGAFLSGGTDSSTVAGTLARVLGRPPQTFSIGFDVEGFDEMGYARIAAQHFGCEHHEYYVTPEDLTESIPRVAASFDQPFGNSSVLPTYYCARLARQHGIDCLLGGDGGDELFGGNTRYAKQRVFALYDDLPVFFQQTLRGALAGAWARRVPLVAKAASYVRQASLGMPTRLHSYNLLTRLGERQILGPVLLERVDLGRPLQEERAWWSRCTAPDLIDRMLALDLKTTLTDNDLPKVVGACQLAGIDVTFPFLDDRMVSFAGALPAHYKLRGLKLRWFFKEALHDFLPEAIITKTKHGFGLPFGVWMTRHEPLRRLARDSLESLSARGLIRADFVDTLTGEILAGHATYYGELVWICMMLEQWLRAHRPATRL